MPELPEVETIARQLNAALRGQAIKTVEVLAKKSFVGEKKKIEGKKIKDVRRKAKLTIIDLGNLSLLVHLKMTGQLVYDEKFQTPNSKLQNKHTRVILHLTRGKLFFNDLRLFGWMKLVDAAGLKREFEHYGPDMIDGKVTKEYFFRLLQSSRRAVKLVICDQAKVAGVGNIYANEGLWCAGVDPRKPANKLSRRESDKLRACLRQVLRQGIKYGGATASDESYVNAQGVGGKYQEHFLVYEQAGKKCQKCKSIIKKIRLGGRGTYYCPGCQK